MIRVLIADEHPSVRESLFALLANEDDIHILGEAADGSTALELARTLRPDLVLLDDSLPGVNSLAVTRALAAELPGTAIVFLARDPGLLDLALTAGATTFVPKDAPSHELVRALRASIAAVNAPRELGLQRPEARRVVELLLASRVLARGQLDDALANRLRGESLVPALVRQGLVAPPELAGVLARATNTPLVSLAPYPEIAAPIDPTESRLSSPRLVDPVQRDAARLVPHDIARSMGFVITAADRGHGVIAMADPLDDAAFAEAQRRAKLELTRVTATADDIDDTLERVWHGGERHVIWTGSLLSKLYATVVLGAIVAATIFGFGLVMRDALAPRFAFSLFALFCGLIFFLYALKYYVTIASVLLITLFGDPARFQGKNANPNGQANGNGLKADGRASANPLASGQHKEGYRTLRGEKLSAVGAVVVDDPWQRMGEIRLPAERQPFVSIQLALYNEGRVVDRLLEACTSFDYENYEVIVADDSNDETVEKLKRWSEHPRVRVIHRSSRKGFKGGALQEALRRMNPRTEYVMVFDADFVPPADAIWHFLDYFGRLSKPKNGNGQHADIHAKTPGAPQNGDRLAVVQGYQWHMLNASENWITKGVRAEFSGSYVMERAGQELFGAMKMISGSVYMIRADVLRKLGWSTSITEDWELTIRLYLAGYKVLYTPYIQAPAECVSKVRQLVKQRMRWAEGHTYNVKKYFWPILRSPNLSWQEKLEFVYYAPYYLQSVLFTVATLAWIVGVLILGQKLPMWGEAFGWSLVISNAFALPLMNLTGVLLEGSLKRDALGLLSFIGLSWILVPFQAYASVKALFEHKEGGWVRTPKSGRVTESLGERFRLARLMPWELPRRKRGHGKPSRILHAATAAILVLGAAGIITVGALSMRAAATGGGVTEADLAIPALVGTIVPLAVLALGWLRMRRRVVAIALAFMLGLGTNVLYLAHAVPAAAVTDNSSVFTFKRTTAFNSPNPDMLQSYAPSGASTTCPPVATYNWTCSWTSDAFSAGQTMNAGTAQADLYVSNNPVPLFRSLTSNVGGSNNVCTMTKPASLVDGDVMIAACAFRGGTGTTITSAPSGWSLIGSRVDNSTTIGLVVYSHVVTSAATEPASYTWNLSASVKFNWSLFVYSGVDPANPIDVDDGQATVSGTSHATPSVNTSVSNDVLVTFHVAAICTFWTPPGGMTERYEGNFCSQSAGSNVDMESNDEYLSAAGATGTRTATNDAASVGVTKIVALRRNTAALTCNLTVQLTKPILYRSTSSAVSESSTTITINKPAGLVDGDVMVASLENSTTAGTTASPANWTLVRSTFYSSVWTKVASSEPASYTWTYGTTASNTVGAISAYSGVDTATPVDVSAINSGSPLVTLPSITTAQPAEMLIASYGGTGTTSAMTWTPPADMIERADLTTTTASFTTLEQDEQLWAVAGPTGSRQTNSTPTLNSVASQWLALRPAPGSFLGSGTVSITSPAGPTLKTVSIATSAVTFAAGDRLQVSVTAPNDTANCGANVSYDGATEPSKLTVATIVPEGVAGLLPLALAIPFAARWWKRRRS